MTISDIENNILKLEKLKNNIERVNSLNDRDIKFIIFRKYLELEKAVEVAKYLNDNGYKKYNSETNSDSIYKSTDITALVLKKNIIEDKWLNEIVNKIAKNNRKTFLRLS